VCGAASHPRRRRARADVDGLWRPAATVEAHHGRVGRPRLMDATGWGISALGSWDRQDVSRDVEGVEFGLRDAATGWGDEEDLVGGKGLQSVLDRLHRV
jgi:hypothetical protein